MLFCRADLLAGNIICQFHPLFLSKEMGQVVSGDLQLPGQILHGKLGVELLDDQSFCFAHRVSGQNATLAHIDLCEAAVRGFLVTVWMLSCSRSSWSYGLWTVADS